MTVEELIEALREMPPTSRVNINLGKIPADMDDDDSIIADPATVIYEFGVTTIECEDE